MQENTEPIKMRTIALGTVGAVAGATLGCAIFAGLLKLGLYALVVPGATAGIGGAWLSRTYSTIVGAICAVVGTAAIIYSEWSNFPFKVDPSLTYFITHLHLLKGMSMLLGAIGIVMAFVFGKGHSSK